MSDLICVTHRLLCREDFLVRLGKIAAARPRAIVLREKDLCGADYAALVRQVRPVCEAHGVPLVLNGHPALALQFGLPVQLPFARAGELMHGGISVHSAEEAEALQSSPAAWLIAGHVWETGCKAGQPGRGTAFLHAVVQAARVPVYAIGGVTPARMREVYAAGAAGACVMSALMTCDNPQDYIKQFDDLERGRL